MEPKVRYWMGSQPTNCDICSAKLTTQFIDGKTKLGPWGLLCISCHAKMGCGLGLGKGQKYELRPDGWLKIEG